MKSHDSLAEIGGNGSCSIAAALVSHQIPVKLNLVGG